MNWYLKCLRQYVDFSGRARRKEYWMFCLFNIIFGIILAILDALIGMNVLSVIYSIGVLLPSLAVCVRRLHDIGKSGWNYFLILIPLVGAIILLVWFCKQGESAGNKWGENPKKD